MDGRETGVDGREHTMIQRTMHNPSDGEIISTKINRISVTFNTTFQILNSSYPDKKKET